LNPAIRGSTFQTTETFERNLQKENSQSFSAIFGIDQKVSCEFSRPSPSPSISVPMSCRIYGIFPKGLVENEEQREGIAQKVSSGVHPPSCFQTRQGQTETPLERFT
jgi:hypothetical protein